MKHIIYLLDGFSPTSLNRYKKKIESKKNYLDDLSKKAIFFKNAYGNGETYSTTYGMFSGKNIYKNYCDAWDIPFSFKEKSSLSKIYKNKGFKTIYYRNAEPNAYLGDFYGRYLKSIAGSFDFKSYKKINNNDNLDRFLSENKLKKKLLSNQKYFIYIHDFTLHDDKRAYNGSRNDYQVAVNSASKVVKKNLQLINYKKNVDTLYFLSDHGLTPDPQSQIHFKKLKKNIFNKYYPYLFKDEKIKFTFFIKFPKKINLNLDKKIVASDIFKIINFFLNTNSFAKKTISNFLNRVSKNEVVISLRDAFKPTYGNYFVRKVFHTHLIFIGKEKKIFSKGYPNQYSKEVLDEFSIVKKNNFRSKDLKYIKKYYSKKNFFKKFFLLFFVYYCFTKLYSVLINRINFFFRNV
jgi:hypothetical protein